MSRCLKAVMRPVRRAAAAAARLVSGGSDRDQLARLAEEQAALRRVATLVAQATPPGLVFPAVTEQVGRLFGADGTRMLRYDVDGSATVVASWGALGAVFPVGTRVPLEGRNVAALVLRTGGPARVDSFEDAPGPLAVVLRGHGVRSAVGAPIVVEGRVWGTMVALSMGDRSLPPDTESRLADFTDLVGTAIANAQARADLTASRARVVAATDGIRRRIERDLHDGTQQRLVSLTLDLRNALASVPATQPELRAALSRIGDELMAALDDLREISRGIHPAVLSRGGLRPALKALARRSSVPVELDVRVDGRLPEQVEVAAYYVAAEALTNAAKHAQPSAVWLECAVQSGRLWLRVRDDGAGGADPVRGSGLIGLTDRVEALGGTITLASPAGQGTTLEVGLPIEAPNGGPRPTG